MKAYPIYDICREAFPAENPDWREPYPQIGSWNDDRVAFEFLRRNAVYWELVEQFYSPGKTYAVWPRARLELYGSIDLTQETYEQLMQRAADEFGLWRITDPRLPLENNLNPWTVAASISARYQYAVMKGDREHDHMEYRFGIHSPPDTITIDVRADAPVEAQVEFVRWVLKRVRSSMGLDHRILPRFQRARFADYLRLLDARSAAARLTTMAEYLYPRQDDFAVDRVRKQLKKAEAMRDGGYRDLLLWSSKIELLESMHVIPDELDELASELTALYESGDSEGFAEVWAEFERALGNSVS
jgi:hypothetical protein